MSSPYSDPRLIDSKNILLEPGSLGDTKAQNCKYRFHVQSCPRGSDL
jgi:hypothetical protein